MISQVVFDFCTDYSVFQTDLSTPHQTINRESTLKKKLRYRDKLLLWMKCHT